MLTHLSIQNFTLVDHLDLDFKAGMTVITGETGAGTSMRLDALGRALDDSDDGKRVRSGTKRAEIHATFVISAIERAKRWLADQEHEREDRPEECLLRRVIKSEGRSKAYINGQPV